jgi:hypothetical protein
VTFQGTTYDKWRLPKVQPLDGISFDMTYMYDGSTDIGYNISAPGSVYAGTTASEFAHLYFWGLDNQARFDFSGDPNLSGGLNKTGDFLSLSKEYYWIGSETSETDAWAFMLDHGFQGDQEKDYYCSAMAVLDGDVAGVSEPAAMLLLGSGLVLLAIIRRKF